LISEKEKLETELKDIKVKIEWMNQNDVETFDEYEFKFSKILNLLEEGNLSTIEKLKLITKLIKG